MRYRHIRMLMFGLLCLAPLLVGCSGADRPPMAPVSGTILYQGEPVEGAHVSFTPTGDSPRSASGVTDAQGRFQLTTFDANDGALLGEHKVTVSKPQEESGFDDIDMDDPGAAYDAAMQSDVSGEQFFGTTLPAKYAEADTTPERRTVGEGENDFTIELTD